MTCIRCDERASECGCDPEDLVDAYRAALDAAHAEIAELRAAAAVTWGNTGLDRVHVPTGTVWGKCVANDSTHDVWFGHDESSSTIERASNGEWKWTTYGPEMEIPAGVGWAGSRRMQRMGLKPTESEAMQAALDAAGWKP